MTIYVKNLSDTTNEFILESAFAPFGEVDSVKVVYDRHSRLPKGYAFVEMSEDAEALKAIAALNESVLDGNVLEVSEAEDRSKKFKIRF